MKKFLSHIVIFALLVIAPVSFSTSKIPNFDKPATRTLHLQESRKANVPVIQRAKKAALSVVCFCPQQSYASYSPINIYVHNLEISHGRAPPQVIHSV